MSFIRTNWLSASVDEAAIEMNKNTDDMDVGDVLSWDRSEHKLQLATSSHDNHSADALFGVCQSDAGTSETVCNVVPFQMNQTFRADCTNNTASTQVGDRYGLTDHDHLANDGSDGTSAVEIFETLKMLGAATDKLLLVRVIAPSGQVTA